MADNLDIFKMYIDCLKKVYTEEANQVLATLSMQKTTGEGAQYPNSRRNEEINTMIRSYQKLSSRISSNEKHQHNEELLKYYKRYIAAHNTHSQLLPVQKVVISVTQKRHNAIGHF